MKIVAVIPVLGRLPLLVHTIDRLYRKNGIYKVICVGEHLEERAIVEAMGAEFVRFKNKPLGKKWNAGFVEARQYSPDAALFMGSSDWVSDNWVPVMYEYLNLFSMVGHMGFNLMDVSKDNGVRMHYWKGYNGVRSEEPIGIGRLISGEMLRKLNYRPVLGQLNNSMDSSMCKKIIKAGGNYNAVNLTEIQSLSISCDMWSNLHSFNNSERAEQSTIIENQEQWLKKWFPEAINLFKQYYDAM